MRMTAQRCLNAREDFEKLVAAIHGIIHEDLSVMRSVEKFKKKTKLQESKMTAQLEDTVKQTVASIREALSSYEEQV